jgi:hypothetical protein
MFFHKKLRLVVPALAALCVAASLPARADSLAGVWDVSVTRVDCTTRSPLAPAFTSLLAFAANGVESEATNNPLLEVGQRSTGFGVWSKTGATAYHLDTFALILFAGTGAHAIPQGSQEIHQDITLSGGHWSSIATIIYFDASGAAVIKGCATAAAKRLT